MRHLEDFRVGEVFPLGTYQITEREIVDFATRYDPQPRHLRPEPIASGWHVASILMRLYVDSVLSTAAFEVSPGVDRLHWLSPVRPGDLLHGEVTVVDIAPSLSRPDCGIIRNRGVLADPEGRAVMRVTMYGLVRRSPTGPIADTTAGGIPAGGGRAAR